MDPIQVTEFIKNWSGIVITVFTALVTCSSIVVRMMASYVMSMRDNMPDYKPSKGLFMLMAILSAIGINSATTVKILGENKPDVFTGIKPVDAEKAGNAAVIAESKEGTQK